LQSLAAIIIHLLILFIFLGLSLGFFGCQFLLWFLQLVSGEIFHIIKTIWPFHVVLLNKLDSSENQNFIFKIIFKKKKLWCGQPRVSLFRLTRKRNSSLTFFRTSGGRRFNRWLFSWARRSGGSRNRLMFVWEIEKFWLRNPWIRPGMLPFARKLEFVKRRAWYRRFLWQLTWGSWIYVSHRFQWDDERGSSV
jgi:hypothetical protein